jgi:hypothetical protein
VPIVSLQYHFRQAFRVPARVAYAWCTDFRSTDARLFGDRRSRTVTRISEDALVLTDVTYPGGRRLRIRRLVRLAPGRLSWTNTHLDGPHRHSQFWYRIIADGRSRSHLEFDGLQLARAGRALSPREIARRAAAEGRHDAATWRTHLAPALHAELAGRRSRAVTQRARAR